MNPALFLSMSLGKSSNPDCVLASIHDLVHPRHFNDRQVRLGWLCDLSQLKPWISVSQKSSPIILGSFLAILQA